MLPSRRVRKSIRSTGAALLGLALLLLTSASTSAQVCASSWDDAGVPIDDPDPPPLPGTVPPDIAGLYQFVLDEDLQTVEQVLRHLPPALRRSYALMETSGTGRPADAQRPRLILFGSDARFLAAIGSHPADPMRETIDLAQLHDATGHWSFASLDMTTAPPTLDDDDTACRACHGSPPRPIWGDYPDWPGAFGSVHDRLTEEQATTLRALHDMAQGAPQNLIYPADRFAHLEYSLSSGYAQADDIFSLPGRVYPYANTVFNMELGTAVADGIYRRMANHPRWALLRESLLFTSYCPGQLPDYWNSDTLDAVRELVAAIGSEVWVNGPLDLFPLLGIDPANDFSVNRRPGEPPNTYWNNAGEFVFGLTDFLTLAELAQLDPAILDLLETTPDLATPFSDGCFADLAELLRQRIYQGWTLRNASRRQAREARFDVNFNRARQGLLDPIGPELCERLASTIELRAQDGVGSVPDGSSLPGPPLELDKVAGGIRLEWAAACGGAADYAVYQGALGAEFNSHTPATCSTGSQHSIELPASGESLYYLIVPLNTFHEGAYGFAGDGSRRSPAALACRSSQLIACE